MSEPLGKLAYGRQWEALNAGLRDGRDSNDEAEFWVPPNRGGKTWSPLYWAAAKGAPRATIALLVATGADVGWMDSGGETALHVAAAYNHTAIVVALGGSHGALVDAQDIGYRRWTPLHYAANHGHTAAARALLELGADASVCGGDGRTALERAEIHGKHGAAQLLRYYHHLPLIAARQRLALARGMAQHGHLLSTLADDLVQSVCEDHRVAPTGAAAERWHMAEAAQANRVPVEWIMVSHWLRNQWHPCEYIAAAAVSVAMVAAYFDLWEGTPLLTKPLLEVWFRV